MKLKRNGVNVNGQGQDGTKEGVVGPECLYHHRSGVGTLIEQSIHLSVALQAFRTSAVIGRRIYFVF
jgi:hypothetical protein